MFPKDIGELPVLIGWPQSDPRAIPRDKDYALALSFNRGRPGISAVEWVAVWRTARGPASRSFPLDAHGFSEALQGAVTTIRMETGITVPKDEHEIASYKERRVDHYLRSMAFAEAGAWALSEA